MRLQYQITLALGTIVLVMGSFMLLYFPAEREASAYRAMEIQAQTTSAIIARSAAAALDFYAISPDGASFELQSVLDIAQENGDVGYIRIFDSGRTEILRHFPSPQRTPKFDSQSIRQVTRDEDMLHVMQPVMVERDGQNLARDNKRQLDEVVGAIQIGFKLDRTMQLVGDDQSVILKIIMWMTLLTALLAILLGKLLTHPLESLQATVSAFGAGDEGARSSVYGPWEIEQLAAAFNKMANTLVRSNASKREKASELQRVVAELREAQERLELLVAAVEHADDAISITDRDGIYQYVNPAFEIMTGYASAEVIGQSSSSLLRSGEHSAEFYDEIPDTLASGGIWSGTIRNRRKDGSIYKEMQTISPIQNENEISGFVAIKRDITEQQHLERQLQQAQKLESIGQLAAGIAHEINTPTQFVGDNIRFIKDAFADIQVLLETLTKCLESGDGSVGTTVLREALEQADTEYLADEMPRAIDQSLEGLQRIAKIVRAMKEFSHPAQEKTLTDLNSAIQSTVTVASNEWKYVAEMVTDFDPELPPVSCLPGEFNQVILNMIVNAAHAIADSRDEMSTEMGTIGVSTRAVNDVAQICISDTGSGMSDDVIERIFDPFFTTKEVGKGTGQGLNIAHDVVVNKHRGTIEVDSKPGQGTRFTIQLPINDPMALEATAA